MLAVLLWSFVAIALAVHVVGTALAAFRLRGRDDVPLETAELPAVSLIRPVCGLSELEHATLASSFAQDHPRHEVIFCAERDDDPVVPWLRDQIAAHPGVAARLLVGALTSTGNPKVDNLAKGVAAARGDWLAMTDANLLLPPDYLRRLAAAQAPGVGLVSAPAVGTAPQSLWGAVECAFLNTDQARWLTAGLVVGLGFAEGKTLYLSRDTLAAIGGLEALGRAVAEDLAASLGVRRAGLRVAHTRRLFAQPVGRRPLAAVWARQLRWERIRRRGAPLVFGFEALRGSAPVALALLALVVLGAAPGWSLAALAAGWWGTEWALARAMGWPHGPRDLLAMLLRDAMQPALWLAAWFGRGFDWHGKRVG